MQIAYAEPPALATRIITTLLCRGRTLVKGRQFNSWRSVGNVAQAVRVHAMRGVDELVLLDIGATPENRGPDLKLVEELAEVMMTPLAIGGGIRAVEHIKQLLRHGADKVVINTALFHTNVLKDAAQVVGCQALIASIDVRHGRVVSHCGTEEWAMSPVNVARLWAEDGAGEILLTSIDREGMLTGYDLDLIRAVSQAVSIPVIAHGGCGTPKHMLEAIRAGADAVAAGAMFQFTDHTPASCAEYLERNGVTVRRNAA